MWTCPQSPKLSRPCNQTLIPTRCFKDLALLKVRQLFLWPLSVWKFCKQLKFLPKVLVQSLKLEYLFEDISIQLQIGQARSFLMDSCWSKTSTRKLWVMHKMFFVLSYSSFLIYLSSKLFLFLKKFYLVQHWWFLHCTGHTHPQPNWKDDHTGLNTAFQVDQACFVIPSCWHCNCFCFHCPLKLYQQIAQHLIANL